jgi:WD repeat-containing protein 23
MSTGTCTVHSWNDNAEDDEADPPLGKSYDCELHYEESFNRHRERLVTMGLVDQSQTPSAQSPSATVRARRGAQVW